MIDFKLNIVLHDKQKEIHKSKARFKVVKAGKRFGKTKWAIFEICQAAGKKPNGVFWYIAPSYKMAKNIAWWELNLLLPKELVKRSIETELYKELINGSRIQLVGADNEDSLRGPRLDGVILDEAAYIKEYVWPAIISGQLLGSNNQDSFAYFISSPNSKGRNWFTLFHSEAGNKQHKGDTEWESFFYTIKDNPTLHPDEVNKFKESTPDDTWLLEYMAEESALSGLWFPEFDYKLHVSDKLDTRPELLHHRFLDWGLNHPTVCLWAAIDTSKPMVYIYQEYFKTDALIRENCQFIKNMTGQTEIKRSIIDPSANKRDPISKIRLIDEFAKWGLYCLPGDRHERGYDIVKMFLKKNLIQIHPKCKNLILQLKNVQRTDKVGDDCTDALRYGLVDIHDTVFSGNLFKQEVKRNYPVHTRELNFNDSILFPKDNKKDTNWIVEEIQAD